MPIPMTDVCECGERRGAVLHFYGVEFDHLYREPTIKNPLIVRPREAMTWQDVPDLAVQA